MNPIERTAKALNPKGIVKSKTTQNLAGTGGTLAGALAFIRSSWPNCIPWGEELDPSIILIGTVLMSRVVAFIRDRTKVKRGGPGAGAVAGILVVALSLGASGCVTVQAPDGTITVRPDMESLQVALIQAEAALEIWQSIKSEFADDEDSLEVWNREAAERRQRVNDILLIIEQIKEAAGQGGNGGS